MTNNKVCKHFVNGDCKKGNQCEYKHIANICSHYFFKTCKNGDTCTKLHTYKLKDKSKKLKKKNTESFEPWHKTGDMRVMMGSANKLSYHYQVESHDIILVQNLFEDSDCRNIYNSLLNEIKTSGIDEKNLWKLWHGDTHMIADDHLAWKSKCPTFSKVIDKIKTYFNMDIKATRLNLFRDSTDYKSYHHDAAAVDPQKTKTQNFTVGVSFGETRVVSFQHATTRTTVDFPLENGRVYAFAKDVNIEWRHGIPQVSPEKQTGEGRISIIAWGWLDIK